MNTRPVEPSKVQQVFAALQSAVGRIVADKLSPTVQFHTEPSRHFFVYRPGRPALRLDVELERDVPRIRFATDPSAVGHMGIEAFAGNETRLRNGDRLMTTEEAANLLLAPFLG